MIRRLSMATAAALVALAGAASAQQPAASPERRVRGVIVEVAGSSFTMKTADGQAVKVQLAEKARIASVSKADLGAISQNEFLGTAAVPSADGTLRALEVHLFPESMRGTGEGHRPWDLQAGSTMTNGTVSAVADAPAPPSTMTNANVAKVSKDAGGVTLLLTYPAGQQTVVVAAGTPVVRLSPADRSVLVPGARAFAAGPAGSDGTVTASRVFAGVGGAEPPM
jgi:hypothetical protein